jgi:hypothetical protein
VCTAIGVNHRPLLAGSQRLNRRIQHGVDEFGIRPRAD